MRWTVPGFSSPYRARGGAGGGVGGCEEKERNRKVRGKEEAVQNTSSLHRGNSCFLTQELLVAPEDAEWKSTSWDVQSVPRQRLPVSPREAADFGRAPQGRGGEANHTTAKPDSDLEHPDS